MSWRREAPEPKLTRDEQLEWQRRVEVPGTTTRVPLFDLKKCTHCGGVHLRACPRVKTIEMSSSGQVLRVEFWPHGQWPEDGILWPEDVWQDDVIQSGSDERST